MADPHDYLLGHMAAALARLAALDFEGLPAWRRALAEAMVQEIRRECAGIGRDVERVRSLLGPRKRPAAPAAELPGGPARDDRR